MTDFYQAMGDIIPFEDVDVFVPEIPLSAMEDISGVKDWAAPWVINAQILGFMPRRPATEFGDPDQNTLQLLIKPEDLLIVGAGFVYRLSDYTVWWGQKPEVEDSGLPHTVINLTQVPATAIPEALRLGAPPPPFRPGIYSMKRVPATFVEDPDTGLLTRAEATITSKVPTWVDPFAISNRANIEPGEIDISEDRLTLTWDLPPDYDVWDPATDFLTFMVEGIV